jgi:pimeloyl-ACP methyl ester carboxylesterase
MTDKRTTRQDSSTHVHPVPAHWGGRSYKNAPAKSASVGGTRFAYRELRIDSGVPVIFLNHLAANHDNWVPRVVDGLAAKHRVTTSNSYDLARRIPNATLRISPDAGHGGIFQAHEPFVPEALALLGSATK